MPAFRVQTAIVMVATLLVLWLGVWFEIEHSNAIQDHLAETNGRLAAQAFGRNVATTVQRVDELLIDLRGHWQEDPEHFAELIRSRQPRLADIALQVAVVGADGYVAFSNLQAQPRSRGVYLGDREHIRVHLDRGGIDRLFISEPVLGKISGRWSLQFSRPVLSGGQVLGVVVVSLEPESLVRFDGDLEPATGEVRSLTRFDGRLLARLPHVDGFAGQHLQGPPFSDENGPLNGTFGQVGQSDGDERIYAFQKIPEFGLIALVGQLPGDIVSVKRQQNRLIVFLAGSATLIILGAFGALWRGDQERERALQALGSSQTMLQSSIDAIGDAFAIYDRDDRLTYFNERYRDLYAHSAAAIERGRSFEEIIRHGVANGQYQDAIGREEDWIQERLSAHRSTGSDQIQQLDDGTWLRVRERKTPEGHVVGFRMDITELIEARKTSEEARKAAESANRLKTEFLANMSHELKTPLNGIIGMSDVLSRSQLDEHQREMLGYLDSCSERLRNLVDDLLDYAALESGTLTVHGHEFSPLALAQEACRDAGTAAQAKGLTLTTQSGTGVPEVVIGDPYRLRQVLQQLLDNAVKFTSIGGITVRTFVEPGSSPRKLRLGFAVRDSGMGISEDDRELIFQPFMQKDGSSSRRHGGTGLGLSLASGIVAQMGGTIAVESVPDYGSQFTFTVEVTLSE